jgi:hypothetical protein
MSDEPIDAGIEEVESVQVGSGYWGMVPARAFVDKGLSRGALRTLGVLSTFASNGRRYAWPKQMTLADRLGVSRWSVRGYIAELKANDYILPVAIKRETKEGKPKGGRRTGYYVLGLPGSIDDPAKSNGDAESPLVTESGASNGGNQGGAKAVLDATYQWQSAPHDSAQNREVEQNMNLEQTINRDSLRDSRDEYPLADPEEEERYRQDLTRRATANRAARENQGIKGMVEEMFDAEVLEEEEVS